MNIAGRNSTPCSIHAGQFCIAAGAWSERLLQMLNLNLPTKPWRGQILLHKTAPGALRHIVNIGSGLDYIIPRSDGHLLIGSIAANTRKLSSSAIPNAARVNLASVASKFANEKIAKK